MALRLDGPIDPHRLALDFVDSKGPIDPPPQVSVANRRHPAEEFPPPVALSPVLNSKPQAAAHITTGGDERDPRRLVESLKSTNDR
jgi:hypothetical protein